jgi:hypothetical protein
MKQLSAAGLAAGSDNCSINREINEKLQIPSGTKAYKDTRVPPKSMRLE